MRCPVCDHDHWENVDNFRFSPKGMAICTTCGFVSYPSLYKTPEEIKKYYREDYRRPPTYANACTGQKKLHIHSSFLEDTLKKWKESENEAPVICEIGAAYGVVLNWLRGLFPKAELSGTELTRSFRRNAWHEYKLNLTEEFDNSKKYDLIISFKVAEHQLDVDKELRRYVEALKKDGLLYISVPTWFARLCNFGNSGYDLEYYYDTAHINCWTKKLFEVVLAKAGLKVVKYDGWMYDDTYLCVRDDELMKTKPEYENPSEIKERMARIKEATVHYMNNQFDHAIKLWPNFPEAWVKRYESNRDRLHKIDPDTSVDKIWNEFVAPMSEACPESLEVFRLGFDIMTRYERYEDALVWINKGLSRRPNQPGFLKALSDCLRQMAIRAKDEAERIKYYIEARECGRFLKDTDLQSRPDAITWIYHDNAHIPTPYETGSELDLVPKK